MSLLGQFFNDSLFRYFSVVGINSVANQDEEGIFRLSSGTVLVKMDSQGKATEMVLFVIPIKRVIVKRG